MAARKKRIAGYRVEIWDTSFRVEGMARTMWVGHHLTDDMVEQLVTAIHDSIADKAEEAGRRRASAAVCNQIHEMIMEA